MSRWLTFAALASALLLGTVWLYRKQLQAPHQASFVIFGGLTEVELRGTSKETAATVFGAIGELLQRDQRAWHPWEISDLMRLNAAIAQGEPYRASPELSGLLRSAQQAYLASDGLFNAAIGSLIHLWGFHTSNFPITAPPPPQQNIDATLATQPRMDQLTIAEDGTVTSTNRAIQLDLNGLAEGYAVKQIAELLQHHGVAHALINVGGDVFALGRAGDRPWRVGIRSPQHENFAGVELRSGEALFTSGSYNKYREDAGQRWGHVLDPRTGHPARGVMAASVIHGDPVIADVATTSLMIAGTDNFERIARRLGVACALLITDNGMVWMTPAMQQRLVFPVPPASVEITPSLGAECSTKPPAT
ncbi:MAG: FAD:protein FMN transferase [Rhodanobacteraceae bacterium]|nr:FAD:protein FMN transferase [Rhodanobacteraceae bacterium]